MSHIQFTGDAGVLEGLLEGDGGSRGAVLCHPHPLYGGSMEDMVLQALNTALRENHIDTLRFNFRGVGGSQGVYGEGSGEVSDVIAAVNYLKSEGRAKVVLCGYSFGAAMAIRAASTLELSRLLLVAPPVQMISGLDNPEVPAVVILGADDQIVDAAAASAFFQGHQVEVLEGADHFFVGAYNKITEIARAAVA